MKKIIAIAALSLSIISCNQSGTTKEFKTAYVDIIKLMDESTEAKDIEEKYKSKSKEMGNKLEVEAANLDSEKKSFESNAQKNGQAWAQQKYGEIQQRGQELQYAQQAILQQLQGESGAEMDSLYKKYKVVFKDYGKEKGYDYIFGNSQLEAVLYTKESYDVTKDIIKIVNDKYKSEAKKEEKPADKKAEAKK